MLFIVYHYNTEGVNVVLGHTCHTDQFCPRLIRDFHKQQNRPAVVIYEHVIGVCIYAQRGGIYSCNEPFFQFLLFTVH
jgi:hypothetical protein